MSCSGIGSSFGSRENESKVAGGVRPPGIRPKARTSQLELERLATELRADLDAQPLAPGECELEAEPLDAHGVPPKSAQPDVHPLVPRVPERVVGEALLLERRIQLAVHGRERVADEG